MDRAWRALLLERSRMQARLPSSRCPTTAPVPPTCTSALSPSRSPALAFRQVWTHRGDACRSGLEEVSEEGESEAPPPYAQVFTGQEVGLEGAGHRQERWLAFQGTKQPLHVRLCIDFLPADWIGGPAAKGCQNRQRGRPGRAEAGVRLHGRDGGRHCPLQAALPVRGAGRRVQGACPARCQALEGLPRLPRLLQ